TVVPRPARTSRKYCRSAFATLRQRPRRVNKLLLREAGDRFSTTGAIPRPQICSYKPALITDIPWTGGGKAPTMQMPDPLLLMASCITEGPRQRTGAYHSALAVHSNAA